MDTALEQLFGEWLREVAFIAKQLTPQPSGQLWYGHPIINISGGEATGQQLPTIIDHQMQLEPIKPAHRTLSTLGEPGKHLVIVNAMVVAHAQSS